MGRNFRSLLENNWAQQKFLCVGLDPDISKLPTALRGISDVEALLTFNKATIDATKDIVCAYKPNSAFYERYGAQGFEMLQETIRYAHEQAPSVPIIYDAKRADIGNTNLGYVSSAFDLLGQMRSPYTRTWAGSRSKNFLIEKTKAYS